MRKRGTLTLSINAIVLLILGISFLALGLVFLNESFTQSEEQFLDVQGVVKEQLLEELRASGERTTLNAVEFDVEKSSKKEFYYAVRNDLSSTTNARCSCVAGEENCEEIICESRSSPAHCSGMCRWEQSDQVTSHRFSSEILCYSAFGDAVTEGIEFSWLEEKEVAVGDVAILKAVLNVPSSQEETTYSCKIGMCQSSDAEIQNDGSVACSAGPAYSEIEFFLNVKGK